MAPRQASEPLDKVEIIGKKFKNSQSNTYSKNAAAKQPQL